VSAEVPKRRVVRLDVKLVVSDSESEDIIWQQTRNSSSKITEAGHHWSTPSVQIRRKIGLVCVLASLSPRSP
jgi:hypothetical protein